MTSFQIIPSSPGHVINFLTQRLGLDLTDTFHVSFPPSLCCKNVWSCNKVFGVSSLLVMISQSLQSQTGLLRSSVTTALTSSRTVGCRRFLSQEVRSKIQAAITETPVVLFMKGTPDYPQCGFSRAAIQVLDLHNVPAEKMKTFDVLEDQELRNAIKEFSCVTAPLRRYSEC